jgi:hypothetical protein
MEGPNKALKSYSKVACAAGQWEVGGGFKRRLSTLNREQILARS